MKSLLFAFATVLIFASCNTGMNTNSNADQLAKDKATTQRFYDEVVNKHNVAIIDSIFSSDFVDHSPDPGYAPTRDGLKKDFTNFFKAFPDMHATVNIIGADSNTVFVQATWTGTNTGAMDSTKPASGKKFDIGGVDILRFKDGKAIEHWDYYEEIKMMKQLGMMQDMVNMAMMDSSKMQ